VGKNRGAWRWNIIPEKRNVEKKEKEVSRDSPTNLSYVENSGRRTSKQPKSLKDVVPKGKIKVKRQGSAGGVDLQSKTPRQGTCRQGRGT